MLRKEVQQYLPHPASMLASQCFNHNKKVFCVKKRMLFLAAETLGTNYVRKVEALSGRAELGCFQCGQGQRR